MLADLKDQLKILTQQSIKDLYPQIDGALTITLDIPSDKKFGEYSTNVAMRMAGMLKKNPLELAGALSEALRKDIQATSLNDKISKIEAVKPGFINFYLSAQASFLILEEALKEGKGFGRLKAGQGQKVQIEFVSANPTGPLSVAHARQAAVGDALGNILKCVGFEVTKEYYINDEGNQINILGRSIELRAREILGEAISFPEEGYQGDYIRDMARIFMEQNHVSTLEDLKQKSTEAFRQFGVDYLLNVIRRELTDFGVHFDVWSSQAKIATNEAIENVLTLLRQRGFIYDQDGAVWFKSTALGDDKDRVVKKSDGSYTYLTPDIVYHRTKFERGFNKVINIWGPDHHGYIPRLKAAAGALGYERDNLEVLIVQLATIFRDGQPLSMSTRRGQYISLQEVMDEVGVDAARFFFLMRHINAHLEFDLELAKKETSENPVYYVQYAHARICSILRLAEESRLTPQLKNFSRLKEEEELNLIKKVSHFPEILLVCYYQLDPFALVLYLQELATVFHKFYDHHRVLDEADRHLSAERLGLIKAAQVVLHNGLTLLGVKAPEKM